jgi:hypothetical protein
MTPKPLPHDTIAIDRHATTFVIEDFVIPLSFVPLNFVIQ